MASKTLTKSPAAPKERAAEKRAVLRMSEKDFRRLRLLQVKRDLTWQQLLSEAVNKWLSENGEKSLEDLNP